MHAHTAGAAAPSHGGDDGATAGPPAGGVPPRRTTLVIAWWPSTVLPGVGVGAATADTDTATAGGMGTAVFDADACQSVDRCPKPWPRPMMLSHAPLGLQCLRYSHGSSGAPGLRRGRGAYEEELEGGACQAVAGVKRARPGTVQAGPEPQYPCSSQGLGGVDRASQRTDGAAGSGPGPGVAGPGELLGGGSCCCDALLLLPRAQGAGAVAEPVACRWAALRAVSPTWVELPGSSKRACAAVAELRSEAGAGTLVRAAEVETCTQAHAAEAGTHTQTVEVEVAGSEESEAVLAALPTLNFFIPSPAHFRHMYVHEACNAGCSSPAQQQTTTIAAVGHGSS